MEENDEELESGLKEDKDNINLSPTMMSSLVISPSKSLARPPPRVLSPIRKPSATACQGDYISDRDMKEEHEEDMLYEGHLGGTQDMRIHSSVVVKSSEVNFCC